MSRKQHFIKYSIYGLMGIIYGYLVYYDTNSKTYILPEAQHIHYILIYLAELLFFIYEFTSWLYGKVAMKKTVCAILVAFLVTSVLCNHYRMRVILSYYGLLIILMAGFFRLINVNCIFDSFFFIVLPFLMIVMQSMEFGYLLAEDIITANTMKTNRNPLLPEMVLTIYLGITILLNALGEVMRIIHYEEFKKYFRKGRISFIHFIAVLILIGTMLNENSRTLMLWFPMTVTLIISEYLDIMKLVRGKLLKGDGCTLAVSSIFGIAILPFLMQFCHLVNPSQACLFTLMMPLTLYITIYFKYMPPYVASYIKGYEYIHKALGIGLWISVCLFLPFFKIYQEQLNWVYAHQLAENISLINKVIAVPCVWICLFVIGMNIIFGMAKGIKSVVLDKILGIQNIYMILAIATALGIVSTSLISKMYQGWNSEINLELNSMCFLMQLLIFIFSIQNIFIKEFAASMKVEENKK